MTNAELHELAAAGVTQRIHAIEAELAIYHKEWPELFLTAPSRLLKAGTPNSNGAGPAGPLSGDARRTALDTSIAQIDQMIQERKAHRPVARAKKATRTMSAATRRKMSLAMKRRHASGEMARARRRAAKKRAAK